MGQYQQQQEMVEPQAPSDVPPTHSELLGWTTGVVVPIVVALIGAWATKRSAYYAAWRNTDKGKAFRERVTEEVTRRAEKKTRGWSFWDNFQ